ncbi:MAG: excinuclease ABC subunit UvrA [Candidatus Sericytochromatia bacterium]|nr:excinuclease ABC subunit UvrA [Candidatus Sericytochromatia bacterium]
MTGLSGVIRVKGARAHNLKDISLEIPRDRLVVFTGVSGSGKSSLAFDTIFAEGQRRYVESLSAYARQFLGQMDKPDVDLIEGLSPAISIDQKSTSHNPRSTVGTVTEIHDYLRLLYARVGVPHCPRCALPISPQSVEQISDRLSALPEGTRFQILAPLVRGRKGEFRQLLEEVRREGFVRVRLDGEVVELDGALPALDKNKKHDLAVIVDRLVARSDLGSRLVDSVGQALRRGEGLMIAELLGTREDPRSEELLFSERHACPTCDFSFAEIEPRLFSFNSPFGACPACHGLGSRQEFDPGRIVPDGGKRLSEAIAPWAGSANPYYGQLLEAIAAHLGVTVSTRWDDLPAEARGVILEGTSERIRVDRESWFRPGEVGYMTRWEGVLRQLERRHAESTSDRVKEELASYMTERDCETCKGTRLKPEALAVRVGACSIADVASMDIRGARSFFEELVLGPREERIAQQILKEIRARLQFLLDVGLDYLTLGRKAGTLSGGEAQRIRLATQIGSGLTGVMYVLDEPSIGLHQRDNERLLATLSRLRDLGNSVLVVEHDEDTIKMADWVVDIGPGAGRHGGEVVFSGPPADLLRHPVSWTGQYLSGRRVISVPAVRRPGHGMALRLLGCHRNNLKNLDVAFPLGCFVCVTGVSGSGKSTLVNDLLHESLRFHLHGGPRPSGLRGIEGLEHVDKVIVIDQAPIGRTPRSNPATYTGLFDLVRETFAQTLDAKARGFGPGRFSFNVKGGRCEACGGEGMNRIEMHFLPDIYVPCEVCRGTRYNRETLTISFKGKHIADVLDMTVDEALDFFRNLARLKSKLQTLSDVGLGYIKLGQPATTLSGGEAQRVKLAEQLSRRSTGRTVLILDEPTTGLSAFDTDRLLGVLQRLVDAGNSVVCIEHNLDVIKGADWLIDLGPEGGAGGGTLVAQGTPENVARHLESHTGRFLEPVLASLPANG